MVKAIAVDWVRLDDFPVTVTVEVPRVAFPATLKVRMLEFVVGFGEKDAVTPLGRGDTDSVTLPLKPPVGVSEIVLVAEAPCLMVRLGGEAESEKPGAGFTTRTKESVAGE